MLSLPADEQDPIMLSDWLELLALSSGDKNSSAGDLIGALKLVMDSEQAETLSLDVIVEIEHRSVAAAEAYPFSISSNGVIKCKGEWRDYVPYVFCLCLAYFGWHQTAGANINPWLLFEELAAVAARQYINGKVYPFGVAAVVGTTSFQNAIDELCKLIGEGDGFLDQPTLRRKDDKVDLIAYRHFPDQRESKLIMFGQCAAGANWIEKISELQPSEFWGQWFRRAEGPH